MSALNFVTCRGCDADLDGRKAVIIRGAEDGTPNLWVLAFEGGYHLECHEDSIFPFPLEETGQ